MLIYCRSLGILLLVSVIDRTSLHGYRMLIDEVQTNNPWTKVVDVIVHFFAYLLITPPVIKTHIKKLYQNARHNRGYRLMYIYQSQIAYNERDGLELVAQI